MLDAEAGTHEHESHFLREALAWLAGMNETQLSEELPKYSASTFHYWLDELETHLQQREYFLGLDEGALEKALN